MICKAYNELTAVEKVEMIGQIAHLIRHNEFIFDEVKLIIDTAQEQGLLDGVKFLPGLFHPHEHIEEKFF